MSDKLRAAALAALGAMKLARGDHGTIMLAYPAIESWLYHRVDQRLDDAITDVEDALAEPAIKESLIAQRPWVGLTHDERVLVTEFAMDDIDVAIRTEAKLREKNT